MNDDTLFDNWVKFIVMLVLVLVLPGWWALLPLVILLTLR